MLIASAGSNLSDYLFFQQPEIVYGTVVISIAVGVLFWIFGNQFHRTFLSVLFLGIGVLAGWKIGIWHDIDIILSMVIGGVLGVGIGYWFYRLWIGLLGAVLIWLVLIALFSWQFAVPYLSEAAQENEQSLVNNGIQLAPSTSPAHVISGIGSQQETPGQAYDKFKNILPKISPREYRNWQEWRNAFPGVFRKILDELQVIIPHLTISILVLGAASLIIGVILAALRPQFLNIIYTSMLGVLLTSFGIFILLALKKTDHLTLIGENIWLVAIVLSAMLLVGVGIQYHLLPPVPEVDDEEDDEDEEDEPPRRGKKKRKK